MFQIRFKYLLYAYTKKCKKYFMGTLGKRELIPKTDGASHDIMHDLKAHFLNIAISALPHFRIQLGHRNFLQKLLQMNLFFHQCLIVTCKFT